MKKINEDLDIELDEEAEVVDEFEFKGFQVVRREFFSHLLESAISIKHDSITFNTASINRLPDTMYVQLLINPVEKKIVIKPCDAEAKDAIRWCTLKKATGKRAPRKIVCRMFAAKLFDMMGWTPEYRYKLQGNVVKTMRERLLVFDLGDTEIYTPVDKANGDNKKVLPYYPEGWRDSFGLPVEAHEKALNINLLDGFARLDIVQKQRTSRRKKTETPVNTDNEQLNLFNVDGTPYDPNEVGGPVNEYK